ncbi:hypothetical protein [Peterkaempfera bronchialis]|uniref:Uncharacterized protein n=1 Tax=Peterkaempfera bronchialis TaxID=2126346 RepID=A0A345SXM9_9ACTN|nr:hypothetical protein [Peterkaempfera bronchialis]AXI78484.1 hypothetical protein C7M71_014635 [Peterkaempfera bronchialis]
MIDRYADVRTPLLRLLNHAVATFADRVDRHGGELGFEVVLGYDDGEPWGTPTATCRAGGPSANAHGQTLSAGWVEAPTLAFFAASGRCYRASGPRLCGRMVGAWISKKM